jgi:hypothetical protein
MAEWLLENNANPQAAATNGASPMSIAAQMANKDLVKLLSQFCPTPQILPIEAAANSPTVSVSPLTGNKTRRSSGSEDTLQEVADGMYGGG